MGDSRISRIGQIGIYVGKHFRLFKNEKGWKVFIFAAIIALLVSPILGNKMFVYNMDNTTGCFILVSACIWIGIFNSIQSICKERAIIKREHRTGLHISSYVVSHLIFQALICLVQAVLMLIVSNLFLDFPETPGLIGGIYVEFFITFFLITYAADVLGLAVSALVKNPTTAMTIMPFVLIIQLVLCDVLISLPSAAGFVGNMTISKWGASAAAIASDYNSLEKTKVVEMKKAVNQIAENHSIVIPEELVEEVIQEEFGNTYRPDYVYETPNLIKSWGILVAHTTVYAIVCVLALELIDRDKR